MLDMTARLTFWGSPQTVLVSYAVISAVRTGNPKGRFNGHGMAIHDDQLACYSETFSKRKWEMARSTKATYMSGSNGKLTFVATSNNGRNADEPSLKSRGKLGALHYAFEACSVSRFSSRDTVSISNASLSPISTRAQPLRRGSFACASVARCPAS